jgi:uncharacterized protein involved in tellurium resistance
MSQLKQKLTLKTKGEHAPIAINQLQVVLQWHASVDLDLMAFFRTKNGQVGGVFSSNYPGGDLGSLTRFPFIQLSADAGVDAQEEGDNQEVLVIAQLDDLAEVYICTLNYTDAAAKRDSCFADYDGNVIVNDNHGHSVTIPLNATQKGQVAVIARIDHSGDSGNGEAILRNENVVLDLGQFFQTIPGAYLLSSNASPPRSSPPTPLPTTAVATPSTQEPSAIARWVEIIRLQAYENPYIDKTAEKELLREAITFGLTIDDARRQLLQVCKTEHYALLSHLEDLAIKALTLCVAEKKSIDQEYFTNTVATIQQAAYGHLKEAECRQKVKELIIAKEWPVRQGFLKGGQWFKEM